MKRAHWILLALSLTGLGNVSGAPGADDVPAQSSELTHVPDTDVVAAASNGVRVTARQLRAALSRMDADARRAAAADDKQLTYIVQLIARNQALAEIAKSRADAEVPYLEERLHLQEQELRAKSLIDALRREIPTPDYEKLAYERYLANTSFYEVPRSFDIQYLVIGTTKRLSVEAEQLAIEAYDKIQSGELSFDEALATYTEEPESERATRGIVKAYPVRDQMPPDEVLGRVLKDLNVGDVTRPFKDKGSFYVATVTAIQEKTVKPFDEVKQSIIAELETQYRNAELSAKISEYYKDELRFNEAILPYLRDEFLGGK